MRIRALALLVCIVGLTVQIPAFGGVTRWTLSRVAFDDGGTAEGFFDLNAEPGSTGFIESWQITVSGGGTDLFPEFSYGTGNSTAQRFNFGDPEPRVLITHTSSNRGLRLQPLGPLTDAGGTVDLNTESGSLECFNCVPVRSITAGSLIAGSAQETLFFPQFGNGGGLASDLVLTNTTAVAATVRVEFRNDTGGALNLGVATVPPGTATPSGPVSTLDFALAPFGTARISTDGSGIQALVGSAVVLSNRRLGGVVRFTITGVGIAGVGSSTPLTQFMVPVRRKAGIINTGLAIENAESTVVQAQLTLLGSDGTAVPNGTATIDNLPGSGHVSRFIDELFPEAATDDFEGSVRVEVIGGSLAAVALELGSAPGQFTTLPVIDLLSQ